MANPNLWKSACSAQNAGATRSISRESVAKTNQNILFWILFSIAIGQHDVPCKDPCDIPRPAIAVPFALWLLPKKLARPRRPWTPKIPSISCQICQLLAQVPKSMALTGSMDCHRCSTQLLDATSASLIMCCALTGVFLDCLTWVSIQSPSGYLKGFDWRSVKFPGPYNINYVWLWSCKI